ncbi:hypothetical protein CAPTEDRAFT_189395 [Capitella teleta]|uniref:Uncharacterized protein n=1 Tax=Capitella teleta TaxID=283909 RepID=R7UFE9_CAPTE|nr:hypothetical protein CAPTEDRAFT_189395 [Capitella teleta]|eukprot:ELU02503.1 hypothetical protein CAPTEDRAFT_189395 [Capitella teleta]
MALKANRSSSANHAGEVATLRTELAAAQQRSTTSQPQQLPSSDEGKRSVAEVVKAPVCCALDEEKATKEVVILKLPENDRDVQDVQEVCEKATVSVKPETLIRLGKINPDRPRTLKASFPTAFDARTFMAKIEQCKEAEPDSLEIRCRPGRALEQQALSTTVYKLNQKTRCGESYSLRSNGEVWKFGKGGDGKWLRATEWALSPSDEGNENGSPRPQM